MGGLRRRGGGALRLGLVAGTLLIAFAVTMMAPCADAQTTPGASGPALPRLGAPPAGAEIRAEITPRFFTTLSSEIAGRIDKIATRPGQRFKKGDVLVVLDCVTQRALLQKARATETAAERTYAVNQRLYKLGSIGDLELQVSEAEVAKTKADVAIADAAVSKCTIAAPFAGVTAEGMSGTNAKKPQEFQYVTPGQPILDVLDDRNLDIEFIAPSSDIGLLRPGARFEVAVEETRKSYEARITRVAPRVDPVSQSIKVYGAFTGDTGDLLPGMSGRVKLPGPS